MFALHFASEVLRVSYMLVLLVCLLTVFGFDRAAGFITALFGGPSEFEPKAAYRALMVMLGLAVFVNFAQFMLDDTQDAK